MYIAKAWATTKLFKKFIRLPMDDERIEMNSGLNI